MVRIAVLDDYANASFEFGDWSEIRERADVTIFDRHLERDRLIAALQPFQIICLMRERTALTADILDRLPHLETIVLSDSYIRTIDRTAAAERGITIVDGQAPEDMPTSPHDTAEFVWGLLLATVRFIPDQVNRLREGHWQSRLGMSLAGKTLGIAGLGRTGSRVAQYANAFGLNVMAWSQNLTSETAAQHGARLVEKDSLFRDSDIVSVHYVLSERSKGIVGSREIGLMKPTSYLINTSRGAIVDEAALLAALQERRIAGAALDVFDQEPLPGDHPLLQLDNVVATPHLGFVTREQMGFYHASIARALADHLRALA